MGEYIKGKKVALWAFNALHKNHIIQIKLSAVQENPGGGGGGGVLTV